MFARTGWDGPLWIGGIRLEYGGLFHWRGIVKGEMPGKDTGDWIDGEPNGNDEFCTQIDANGLLDRGCSETYKFLCETDEQC